MRSVFVDSSVHIEPGDAPNLAAAVAARVDHLTTLNTRDFMPAVATATGLDLRTPGELIVGLRQLLERESP